MERRGFLRGIVGAVASVAALALPTPKVKAKPIEVDPEDLRIDAPIPAPHHEFYTATTMLIYPPIHTIRAKANRIGSFGFPDRTKGALD